MHRPHRRRRLFVQLLPKLWLAPSRQHLRPDNLGIVLGASMLCRALYCRYYTHATIHVLCLRKEPSQETNLFPTNLTLEVESIPLRREQALGGKRARWPERRQRRPAPPRGTHQHVHVESPAVLPRADAQGLQVHAALVAEYPRQGVSDLRAKVIASSTFKFRGRIG